MHYIVDGNNVMAINAHAHPTLCSRDGRPTGAIFGTLRMLNMIMVTGGIGTTMTVVFDAGRPAFRSKLCPTYKSNRTTKPEDEKLHENRREQMLRMPNILRRFGVNVAIAPGWEADDVIAALVEHDDLRPSVVVSGDKDLLQLIGDGVSVMKPSGYETITVKPRGYLLSRCMIGDASDVVPGIKGIGPKRAEEIVAELIEEGHKPRIYEMLKHYKGKHRKYLDADPDVRAHLRANWTVMCLKYSAPLCQSAIEFAPGAWNEERAHKWLRRLEFKSLLANFAQFTVPFRRLKEIQYG